MSTLIEQELFNMSDIIKTKESKYKNTLEEIKGMITAIMQTPISERSSDVYSVTLTRIYNLCVGALYQKEV